MQSHPILAHAVTPAPPPPPSPPRAQARPGQGRQARAAAPPEVSCVSSTLASPDVPNGKRRPAGDAPRVGVRAPVPRPGNGVRRMRPVDANATMSSRNETTMAAARENKPPSAAQPSLGIMARLHRATQSRRTNGRRPPVFLHRISPTARLRLTYYLVSRQPNLQVDVRPCCASVCLLACPGALALARSVHRRVVGYPGAWPANREAWPCSAVGGAHQQGIGPVLEASSQSPPVLLPPAAGLIDPK
ncbi:hypothetical protein ACCO45_008858 [Purpureocillium lilacinum]